MCMWKRTTKNSCERFRLGKDSFNGKVGFLLFRCGQPVTCGRRLLVSLLNGGLSLCECERAESEEGEEGTGTGGVVVVVVVEVAGAGVGGRGGGRGVKVKVGGSGVECVREVWQCSACEGGTEVRQMREGGRERKGE